MATGVTYPVAASGPTMNMIAAWRAKTTLKPASRRSFDRTRFNMPGSPRKGASRGARRQGVRDDAQGPDRTLIDRRNR